MAKKRRKRASFRAKADRIWSRIVRLAGECAVCGATKHLNAHHLIPRQLVKYRHVPENGICLCPRCHKFSFELSAHRGPLAFAVWFQKNRPKQFKWWKEHYKDIPRGIRMPYKTIAEDLEKVLVERSKELEGK